MAKAAAGTVSAADVGDADSFGRSVRFIGVAQSGLVDFEVDCTPSPDFPPGPDDRCVVIAPPPATTSIEARDIGRIKLPAKASNSVLCHSVTSTPSVHFNNTLGTRALASLRYSYGFTIDNEVLNDPTLIDPNTGLPLAGSLEVPFGAITDQQTLQPGDQATRRSTTTRMCIGGLVNKSALIDTYGLTPAQADDFFKKPMTIHLNLTLQTRLADQAFAFFGVRLYGD